MRHEPHVRINLDGARAIRDRANAKAMDKLVELADRVQAIREREVNDYFNSIDFLEDNLKSAYQSLRERVGKHRADECAVNLVQFGN